MEVKQPVHDGVSHRGVLAGIRAVWSEAASSPRTRAASVLRAMAMPRRSSAGIRSAARCRPRGTARPCGKPTRVMAGMPRARKLPASVTTGTGSVRNRAVPSAAACSPASARYARQRFHSKRAMPSSGPAPMHSRLMTARGTSPNVARAAAALPCAPCSSPAHQANTSRVRDSGFAAQCAAISTRSMVAAPLSTMPWLGGRNRPAVNCAPAPRSAIAASRLHTRPSRRCRQTRTPAKMVTASAIANSTVRSR